MLHLILLLHFVSLLLLHVRGYSLIDPKIRSSSSNTVDDSTRRSALLFPVQATTGALLMPYLLPACTASAYDVDEAVTESIKGRSLFLSSSNILATSGDDMLVATNVLDIFKLSEMPTQKAKMAVQVGGDRYSRVVDSRRTITDPYDILGVGVTLNQSERGGQIIVSAVRAGSPADDAGFKYGDAVLTVNGKPTKGRNVFDVVEQVSETLEARTVSLTIEEGTAENTEKKRRVVVMTRDFSNVPDPVSYGVSERRPDGAVVGYIQLSQFNSRTTLKMKEAILALKSQGVNAFVIDVRGNGGGALQSALWTVKLFLGGGKIILNSAMEGSKLMPYRAEKSNVLIGPSIPIVVLINKGSASATEIFASALQDNCRAVVLGERSYGKGLIQATIGLEDGSRLVVTAGRYLTPNRREIQGKGIVPDIPGRGIIASSNKPGERLDTSKIDFREVSAKLSQCSPPTR